MVTLPLERMASRVAASLCYATGLGGEMVVGSQGEYEELAVSLGLNHSRRLLLRQRLKRARLRCASVSRLWGFRFIDCSRDVAPPPPFVVKTAQQRAQTRSATTTQSAIAIPISCVQL